MRNNLYLFKQKIKVLSENILAICVISFETIFTFICWLHYNLILSHWTKCESFVSQDLSFYKLSLVRCISSFRVQLLGWGFTSSFLIKRLRFFHFALINENFKRLLKVFFWFCHFNLRNWALLCFFHYYAMSLVWKVLSWHFNRIS